MLLMFERVVLKYLKNLSIRWCKIIFPFPLESSICPYQIYLRVQKGISPSTSSWSCVILHPQHIGQRPSKGNPQDQEYTEETQGRCQSLRQSVTGRITSVGAAVPSFPPRRLSCSVCVHFWDLLFVNEVGGNYSFTQKNSTKFPANPKSCRLYGWGMLFLAEIVLSWQYTPKNIIKVLFNILFFLLLLTFEHFFPSKGLFNKIWKLPNFDFTGSFIWFFCMFLCTFICFEL